MATTILPARYSHAPRLPSRPGPDLIEADTWSPFRFSSFVLQRTQGAEKDNRFMGSDFHAWPLLHAGHGFKLYQNIIIGLLCSPMPVVCLCGEFTLTSDTPSHCRTCPSAYSLSILLWPRCDTTCVIRYPQDTICLRSTSPDPYSSALLVHRGSLAVGGGLVVSACLCAWPSRPCGHSALCSPRDARVRLIDSLSAWSCYYMTQEGTALAVGSTCVLSGAQAYVKVYGDEAQSPSALPGHRVFGLLTNAETPFEVTVLGHGQKERFRESMPIKRKQLTVGGVRPGPRAPAAARGKRAPLHSSLRVQATPPDSLTKASWLTNVSPRLLLPVPWALRNMAVRAAGTQKDLPSSTTPELRNPDCTMVKVTALCSSGKHALLYLMENGPEITLQPNSSRPMSSSTGLLTGVQSIVGKGYHYRVALEVDPLTRCRDEIPEVCLPAPRQSYEGLERRLKGVFAERTGILRQLSKTSKELDGIKGNLQCFAMAWWGASSSLFVFMVKGAALAEGTAVPHFDNGALLLVFQSLKNDEMVAKKEVQRILELSQKQRISERYGFKSLLLGPKRLYREEMLTATRVVGCGPP
ncbi:hypothetical protein Z043_104432 [Scleropages formosus]|uniref:Uncharacterized protein n=1 Tax=Scleropages formosus TaxID=113540 RepID=A0A0P7V0X3_SCLFO|nr:hypothetical protein Z043_104432 [Scleropages formosus]